MPYVQNDLLDLRAHIGQRAESIEYNLMNDSGRIIGRLHPQLGGVSVRCDTTAQIKRTLNGLTLAAAEYDDINPFADRVAPRWVLEDGTVWPLGVFYFTSAPTARDLVKCGPLFDKSILLDQQLLDPYGVPANGLVATAMEEVALRAGFNDAIVSGTDTKVAADQPIGFPAGESTWRDVVEHLAQLAGFLSPYIGLDNRLHFVPPPPMVRSPRTITYDSHESRIHPNPERDPNLLDAPNVHVVVATGRSEEPVTARAFIDGRLPWSKESNGGRIIAEVHKLQGIATTAQAQAMANQYAITSADDYEVLTFTSAPDPRHDLFEIIAVNGVVYRELGHELTCAPGGAHTHRCVQHGELSNASV